MLYRALVPVPEFGAGAVCADDVREPLLDWRTAVSKRGGELHANSLTRTAAQQQVLRDRYTSYLNAKAEWEKRGRQGPAPKAVAATNKPGRSNHQGGRAIDANTVNAFPGEPADQQVDLLWATGNPIGWRPIIKTPDEATSERWHFDFWNGWDSVRLHLGYETACLCSALDVGQAGDWQSDDRLLQALLLRAGFDIGEPDGVFGKRSAKALELAVGAKRTDRLGDIATALRAMPATEKWIQVR